MLRKLDGPNIDREQRPKATMKGCQYIIVVFASLDTRATESFPVLGLSYDYERGTQQQHEQSESFFFSWGIKNI